MNKKYLFIFYTIAFMLIDGSAKAESPISGIALSTFYTDYSACVLNEYKNVNSPVNSTSKCFAFAIHPGSDAPKF